MPGPAPRYRPAFPPEFLHRAAVLAHQRTAPSQLRQRASLVLLLHQQPLLSNAAVASRMSWHPNSVRLWRKRWARGYYTLDDEEGRGRKPHFPPPG